MHGNQSFVATHPAAATTAQHSTDDGTADW
jgi:hypothetical protein